MKLKPTPVVKNAHGQIYKVHLLHYVHPGKPLCLNQPELVRTPLVTEIEKVTCGLCRYRYRLRATQPQRPTDKREK